MYFVVCREYFEAYSQSNITVLDICDNILWKIKQFSSYRLNKTKLTQLRKDFSIFAVNFRKSKVVDIVTSLIPNFFFRITNFAYNFHNTYSSKHKQTLRWYLGKHKI